MSFLLTNDQYCLDATPSEESCRQTPFGISWRSFWDRLLIKYMTDEQIDDHPQWQLRKYVAAEDHQVKELTWCLKSGVASTMKKQCSA